MLGNLLSLKESLLSKLAIPFALVAVFACLTTIWYRNEAKRLTELRQAEAIEAEASYTYLFRLHQREKKDYADAEARITASNDALLAERDRLRKRLDALQATGDSSASGERGERSEALVHHLGRCADLASQCAVELRRKDAALKACVRAYENARLMGSE